MAISTSTMPRFMCAFIRSMMVAALVFGALAPAFTAEAAPLYSTILVNTTADESGSGASCSLREAITAANTDAAFGGCPAGSGADVITLPAGTYTLSLSNTSGINEDNNTRGDLDILASLMINGAGAGSTIIQAGTTTTNGIDKVFGVNPFCSNGVNVSISGVTIRYGYNTQTFGVADYSFTGAGLDWCGGSGNESFSLSDSVVEYNTNLNGYGGGLNIDSISGYTGNITITNVTFDHNSTEINRSGDQYGGGAITIWGYQPNVTVTGCTFTGNSIVDAAASGGAIFFGPKYGGSLTIHNSTFSGNTSVFNGGAIGLDPSVSPAVGIPTVVIDQNTQITNNTAGNNGGGIFIDGGYLNGTNSLSNLTISGNAAINGGGIYSSLAAVTMQYSRIVNNTASGSGSGAYKEDQAGAFDIRNNWWGCSTGPAAAPCDTAVAPNPARMDASVWLRDNLTSSAGITLVTNQISSLTASYLTNSAGSSVTTGQLSRIIGLPVTWSATAGTLSATQSTVQAAGTATGTFQATAPGTSVVAAKVDNDATTGSGSNVQTITINKADTTTTITSDAPDPSTPGGAVTVAVSVTGDQGNTPTAPSGTVSVSDGTDSCTITLPDPSCSLTLTTLGARTITATYSGDANFNGSTSTGESHTVSGYTTTTTITGDTPDPSTVGQAVNVSYTITSAQPGTPTGNVTVSDGVDSCTGTVATGFCSLTLTTTGARSLTATYAGDAIFMTSASTAEAHTVNQASTTTTISSDSPDPSVVGQSVTFNYSVGVVSPGAGTPTGNVTVSNGTDSCTATVAAGSCNVALTAVGTTNFIATYAGDTNFAGSASAAEAHTVNQASTTTTISSDTPDPSVAGQSVTFNYSVGVISPGAGTPSGNVTVSNGTDSCTATVAAGSCSVALTAVGTTNFTATYAGDTNFAGSTSPTEAHTVNQATTTTTISSDTPDPSVAGQPVTFNYSVGVVSPGAGTPTGNVTVSNGTDSCTGTVAAGSCSITLGSIGTANFTATYGGDTNFTGSASAVEAHTVNQAGVTTTITADSPDPSVVGQSVTFGYSVSVDAPGTGAPTGNVTVSDGANSCTGTVAAGSCAITLTAAGTSNFTATYAGDTNFAGSASAVEAHTVNQASTTTTISSDSPDPSVVGQSVTFNYSVSVTTPGAGTPTGNVTVSNGADSCTGTVAAGSCAITLTAAGTTNFTATYAGDSNFAGSSSSSAAHTVSASSTTAQITSNTPNPSLVGEPVTFSFTVAPVAPAVGTPTGNVTVSDGTNSCTATVAAGSCSIAFPSVGSKSVTATYAGDSNFNTSTSSAQAQTVNAASTTIAITSDLPDPSSVGVALPVAFQVTVVAPGAGTPTGTVTITDGVDTCTAAVAAGSCNLTLSTIGGRLLTASYAGDSNFGGSTSIPEAHTVQVIPAVTQVNSVADTGDGEVQENEHTSAAITQLLVTYNKTMGASAGLATNYSLKMDGSSTEYIDGGSYDSGTNTLTLSINSGSALPDGRYTLTASGSIADSLGTPMGTDFVRHFTVDASSPSVLSSGVTAQPGGEVIQDNGVYLTHFTAWSVAFSDDVSDAGGGTLADDVTNPHNYLLLQAGPNGVYDTTDCQAFATNGYLPLGDDLSIPVSAVSYDNHGGVGPFMAAFTVNNGHALPTGVYRLHVCGTTSIVDLAGNALNGGSDAVRNFTITDPAVLPSTGFAPGRVTVLPEPAVAYTQSDLWLEIPKLGVTMDIVGVPQSEDGSWDVSWLGSDAGWLNGTAYPTWNGNSVITGHVVNSNGGAGPFRNLSTLRYGDRIILHNAGSTYVYEVRGVSQVAPDSTEQLLKHEDRPWVTLVTCRGYDAETGKYLYRVLVRAVLVAVE